MKNVEQIAGKNMGQTVMKNQEQITTKPLAKSQLANLNPQITGYKYKFLTRRFQIAISTHKPQIAILNSHVSNHNPQTDKYVTILRFCPFYLFG